MQLQHWNTDSPEMKDNITLMTTFCFFFYFVMENCFFLLNGSRQMKMATEHWEDQLKSHLPYRSLCALHLAGPLLGPGKHTPVPCHTFPGSPTSLHSSPPQTWHRRGSSRRRRSWLHLYTGASEPVGRSSVFARREGSEGPEAAELLLTPLLPTQNSGRTASTLLMNLILSCLVLLYTAAPGVMHQPGSVPLPYQQPIDESRGGLGWVGLV